MATRHPEIEDIRSLAKGELDPVSECVLKEHIKQCDRCCAVWTVANGIILDQPDPTELPYRPDAGCPDPESLAAYSEGCLSDSRKEEIRVHLAGCRLCAETVEWLVGEAQTAAAAAMPAEAVGAIEKTTGPLRRLAAIVRSVGEGCLGVGAGLIHSLGYAIMYTGAGIDNALDAARKRRVRKLVRPARDRWVQVGTRLFEIASQDIHRPQFDEGLIRLEGQVSSDLDSLCVLKLQSYDDMPVSHKIRDVLRFAARLVTAQLEGMRSKSDAREMIHEWNEHYYFLNELMMNGQFAGNDPRGTLFDSFREGVASALKDRQTREIASAAAFVFVCLYFASHSAAMKPALVPLAKGVGSVLSGIGSALMGVASLFSALKREVRFSILQNKAAIVLLYLASLTLLGYGIGLLARVFKPQR